MVLGARKMLIFHIYIAELGDSSYANELGPFDGRKSHWLYLGSGGPIRHETSGG